MTKQKEIEIVKKLTEIYPELKSYIVKDGLFRKGSDKKILSIITDDNDKIQFHICNELRNKRKNNIVEKVEVKVEEKDKKIEEKVEEQIKEETTDEELNEILEEKMYTEKEVNEKFGVLLKSLVEKGDIEIINKDLFCKMKILQMQTRNV